MTIEENAASRASDHAIVTTPLIQFEFEGVTFDADMEFYETNECRLPDGRIVEATSWNETHPPMPCGIREQRRKRGTAREAEAPVNADIGKIEDAAKYIYRALDYIRQRADILADDLKPQIEAKHVEELQAIGGSANAAIVKAMEIGDQCRSS